MRIHLNKLPLIAILTAFACPVLSCRPEPVVSGIGSAPGAQETLHRWRETKIADDMIFSSCCAWTTASVQLGFDYDPEDNTVYFSQLDRGYRNIISWTTPEVTLSTKVTPQYMGLSCFSHGNSFIIERTEDGEKYVWAPNFGSRGDDSYGDPWIVSRMPLKATSGVKEDVKNTDPDENYYFGVSPCWPAIDFDQDLIAICDLKKTYVYSLSDVMDLPVTTVKLPTTITYGGIMTSSSSMTTYDTGIPEYTGQPEILARDASGLKPISVFDSSFGRHDPHWQAFCIGNGQVFFLSMDDVPGNSVIKLETYLDVYDLKTGKRLNSQERQEYMKDLEGLVSRGYAESDYCYAEPEAIKVMGDVLYIMYTCRGNTTITECRPVVFKFSSKYW